MKNDDKQPERAGSIAWMAGNSVAANLLMALCLVGGFLFLRNIKQEVFPDFQEDEVAVTVEYPGASPEEVEEGVVLPVEEAVEGLQGVDEIRSTAAENVGSVVVEAVRGTNIRKLKEDVQSEIDRITTFPDDAEEPEVRSSDRERGVLNLVLYGETDRKTLHRLGERVRTRMIQNPNITRVNLSGLPELEIGVEVSQETLRRYDLTPGMLSQRIRERAIDVPGGDLDTESSEVLVRMKERLDYGHQFARLSVINTPSGSQIPLERLATVDDGFEEMDSYMIYNGQPAVQLSVFRVGGQSPVQVQKAVSEELEGVTEELPSGIRTAIFDDRAESYRQRADLMMKNGALGLVLVLVLLSVFLEARLAFWVMMGIPISFLGTFLLLPTFGVSLNMLSMFAFIIALGIVVDDAIVVGENVYRYRQRGMPAMKAAVKGAQEVAMPVTFSILTNVVAFMPLYFIPGPTGQIFGIIPVVVGSAFFISLIECLFVLPAHLSHETGRRNRVSAQVHRWQQAFSDTFTRWVRERYGPFLDMVLRHRYFAFVTAFSVLTLVLAYAGSGRMGMGLFPETESDFAIARFSFPPGTPAKRTEEAGRKLVAAARGVIETTGHDELLEGVLLQVGGRSSEEMGEVGSGSNSGSVRVLLADADVRERTMNTQEFTRRWRDAAGELVGADYVKYEASGGGPGGGADVNVELRHPSIDVLRKVSSRVARQLREYPMVSEVDDGFQPGKPQFDLKMKSGGKALGLTAEGVGRQVRASFYGARAIRQLRGRNEVDVRVKLPARQRDSVHHLEELMVYTPGGMFVPLSDVAHMDLGRAYITIDRRNGQRTVQVTGDATPDSKAGNVLADLRQTILPELEEEHPELSYSFQGVRADIRESLGSLQMTFGVAMLMIYAMLAIPFRSYVQPFIVMLSIPFGVVGAVLGHLLMGYGMTVISLFGVVALAGVVVNDSLILITFANRARQDAGTDRLEAIREAAKQRFRPVLLTSLTTFGGLMPLIFETSRQARIMIPMAISLGYGILFALFITLALVPVLYLTVDDAKEWLARRRERNEHQ